ncbi:MAG: hypothetical protein FVQ79_04390 [Planctomycetes bacterium]|nr:hypothetical protein [Planctomycetota bacterium]
MLHDPSHYTPPPVATAIKLSNKDTEILRGLAGDVAQIASLGVHKEKAKLWTKLNDLESERPMVWINEICWNEMNIDDELTLQCEHSWARDQEDHLRKTIYQWKHLPGDMVVSDFLVCPLAIHSTDFGIIEDVDVVTTDDTSDVVSRHFNVQIKGPEDIEKIKMPVLSHNEMATELNFQAMCKVYDGIISVKKQGQTHIWFTPWDFLIRWWGIQEAMMDMIMRGDMVNAAVERMVDAWMVELDQFERLNLLSLDNDNTRVGSGGYGYTSQLPGGDFDAEHVMAKNMWGCSNAQIFSEVSPEMHWEFAIKHDMRWLERFGMTYYGCCEPLDKKMDVLRKIPNLRKISTSPWCDIERMVAEVGADYVISQKPSPAIFAESDWRPEQARSGIRDVLEKADGNCHIEFIMKDISTVRRDPKRLWQWSQIAMEEVENYS